MKAIFTADRFSFSLAAFLLALALIVAILGSFFHWNPDLIGALAGALISGAATLLGTAIASRHGRLAEIERQNRAEVEVKGLTERIRTMILADVRAICQIFLRLKPTMDHAITFPSLDDGMIQVGNVFLRKFHETSFLEMIGDHITLLGAEELLRLGEFLSENSLVRYDLGQSMANPGRNNPSNAMFARQRISDLLSSGANLIEVMRPNEQLRIRNGQSERAVDLLRRVANSHIEP